MLASVGMTAPASADEAGKGGDFVALNTELLDTRSGVNVPVVAKSVTSVAALGVGGIPTSGVRALLVDITGINPTANTFLTVYPKGATRPEASSINVSKGEVLSNSVVVTAGTDGKIDVFNHLGSTHFKLDVQGYFTNSSAGPGGGFVPVEHTRVVDTRSGLGTSTGTIAGGGARTVTLTGGVVPAGATAAVIDVVITGATGFGWFTAAPANQAGAANAIDYVTGTTSMGMAVKLPVDGKVVLTNRGGVAVHAVVSVQGYVTASSTTGAGLRMLPAARLLDTRAVAGGMPLPANGTIDVAIGGTNGLPTRGIAGAAVNLTAVSPAGSGNLSVWALDGTASSVSTTNFTAGQVARSSFAVSRVGTEGKVRVRNNSPGTVHLLVDLQGWFADPIATLPVAPFTRTSVLQARPDGTQFGALTYAYTDNLGRLRTGHQSDPGNFGTVQWSTASGFDAFTGQPTVNQLADKKVQVAVQNVDSNIAKATQTATGAPTWTALSSLGGSMAGPPASATLEDGTSVLFAVDADGRLWHYRQTATAPSWKSLGNPGLAGPVTVQPLAGGVRLVVTGTTGTVKTALYDTDGTVSAWADLGGNTAGAPATVFYPGNRTRILARATDGSIITKLQNVDLTWPSTWAPVGTFTAAGAPAAIMDPVLGRIAVVARGADKELYRVFETAMGSGVWGEWQMLNPYPETPDNAATDPTVVPFIGNAGESWLIVFRNANDFTRVYERQLPQAAQTLAARSEFVARSLPAPPR
ncbi:hypothetical protein [Micromonospora sp. NPDC049679]|uniref:hypothetical protein n=1 Tax=Micromonospora sp. NPDC049679 TaxID=3155920 RepID=UPI0033C00966